MTRTILVTGGAGYIGSHVCLALAEAGYLPVAYDNLVTGWREAVQFGPFERGDLRDQTRLEAVLDAYQPLAVMHFAALSDVGQASREPELYWDNNLVGSLRLVEAMLSRRVPYLILSSTCAIFGDHDGVALTEDSPRHPTNAYGASKGAVEDMVATLADRASTQLRHVALRYFNVAGADPAARVGEFHRPETHLIPRAFEAVAPGGQALTLYGDRYPTPDGTCIRDYVHVMDLVAAHLQALEYLLAGGASTALNLGSGRGFSVREILDAVAQVTGRRVPIHLGPRRPGDCACLVSGSQKARRLLGWRPEVSTPEQMIASAWAWYQTGGYQSARRACSA